MFHQGDLQSGITAAIQQQKLVTCFIHDEDPTSTEWEQTVLTPLEDLIPQKTVLLKIRHGSPGAGFLSAFCPVQTAPALVVINNGKVLTNIGSEASTDECRDQLMQALRISDDQQDAATQSSQPLQSASPASTQPSSTRTFTEPARSLQTPLPPPQLTARTDSEAQSEEERLAQKADAKAARVAAAEARRREIEATHASSSKGKQPADDSKDLPPKARVDWMQQQSKRKQELKAERERILARIQADREERKARAANPSINMSTEPLRRQSSAGVTASGCALQIRLVDGSSIKRHFSADESLKDVRKWIKETASEESITKSYTFRQLLVPKPSRAIDGAEEGQTLRDIGLTPSATLIVSPAEEPEVAVSSNVFMRIVATILGIISSLVAWLGSLGGQHRPSQGSTTTSELSTGKASGIDEAPTARLRTRTLADARADKSNDEPTQYYNGNSSAFEGRKDDDEQ